jgi:hypothetical protein
LSYLYDTKQSDICNSYKNTGKTGKKGRLGDEPQKTLDFQVFQCFVENDDDNGTVRAP